MKAESSQLRGEVESMLPGLESVKAKLDEQMRIRSHVRKVLPEALAFKNEAGQQKDEDITEEIQNQRELRQLLEQSAERMIRQGEDHQPNAAIQREEQQQKEHKHRDRQAGR